MIAYTKVPCSSSGELDPDDVARAIRPNTRLLAFLHGSNVCGVLFPIADLARLAREYEIPLLIDAAQTAGSCPIDVRALELDLVAFPGHKGLLGPLGTGALWVRKGISLRTVTEGGTGSISEQEVQPPFWPDRHEAGSHNSVGLVGLSEGLRYLLDRGVGDVRAEKEELVGDLIHRLEAIEEITVYGPRDPALNAGVVSIRIQGWDPTEFAVELDRRHRINVRPGLHCAPGAHKTLGTLPEGTIRFSFGPFTTADHVRKAARAVEHLAHRRVPAAKKARAR
jgi:selenocysteine lyase/cysteine desulfurase